MDHFHGFALFLQNLAEYYICRVNCIVVIMFSDLFTYLFNRLEP